MLTQTYLYIIKQDIRIYIYVTNSRPNGWTDFLCGHTPSAFKATKFEFIFQKKFSFPGQRQALQLVSHNKLIFNQIYINRLNVGFLSIPAVLCFIKLLKNDLHYSALGVI